MRHSHDAHAASTAITCETLSRIFHRHAISSSLTPSPFPLPSVLLASTHLSSIIMAPLEEMQQAQINRSIRTIKAELEYLCDATVITPQTLSDLLSRIPPQTALHAPISVGALPNAIPQNTATGLQAPMNNLNLSRTQTSASSINEKQDSSYYQPPASPQPPPPTYASQPPQASWAPLCQATALYAYTSSDAGDLELQPGDTVSVTEYMNAEWWKGRSSRTGAEGIFPRSYVKVSEEKAQDSNTSTYANNYGNAPLEGQFSLAITLFHRTDYQSSQSRKWAMARAGCPARPRSRARSLARS